MSDIQIAERIKEARIGTSLSQIEISKKLEITDKTYRTYEKGKDITVGILKKIAKITNTDFNYLLSGATLPTTPNKSLSKDTVGIRYYPEVYAAAGYGAINEETKPQIMNFDRNFIEQFLNVRKIEKLDIIRIIGDSMEPFIHNGELVMLERDTEARNGETVIANINGQVYVKRFQADPFKKWIKLVSDNEIYGDISLDSIEEIQALTIIGIVRARIKQF